VQLLTVAGDADHGLDMEDAMHQKKLCHSQRNSLATSCALVLQFLVIALQAPLAAASS
jgi:hypothetical protein